ncbi:MAG: hypothetical protein WBL68_04570, partial [Nitrososphaeraceae archaeon]
TTELADTTEPAGTQGLTIPQGLTPQELVTLLQSQAQQGGMPGLSEISQAQLIINQNRGQQVNEAIAQKISEINALQLTPQELATLSPEEIEQRNSQIQLQVIALQDLVDRRNQVLELLSTLPARSSDIRDQIIGNLR